VNEIETLDVKNCSYHDCDAKLYVTVKDGIIYVFAEFEDCCSVTKELVAKFDTFLSAKHRNAHVREIDE